MNDQSFVLESSAEQQCIEFGRYDWKIEYHLEIC